MRLSFVRLVAVKEIRDLFRDRRTLLLVFILPAVLYPLFCGGFFMARSMRAQEAVIGIFGAGNLPADNPSGEKEFPPFLVDGKIVEERKPDDTALDDMTLVVKNLDTDPIEALSSKQVDVVLEVPTGFVEAMKDPRGPKPKLI